MSDTHNHYHFPPDHSELRAELRVLSELVELNIRNGIKWRAEIMLRLTELKQTAEDLGADLVEIDQKVAGLVVARDASAADQAVVDGVTDSLAAARQQIAELSARIDGLAPQVDAPASAPAAAVFPLPGASA